MQEETTLYKIVNAIILTLIAIPLLDIVWTMITAG